jgi:hypothetical protein
VLQSADPGNAAFDSHAEATMGNGAIATEIDVPVKGFLWELVFVEPGHQEVQIMDTLTASNNLAVSFGS